MASPLASSTGQPVHTSTSTCMAQRSVGASSWRRVTFITRLPRGSRAQASLASRPLSWQIWTVVVPLMEEKSLFSRPSWTGAMTFCHMRTAGLPPVVSMRSGLL